MTQASNLVIGIDAGATKTAAVAGRLDGGVLDRLRTSPSAVIGLPDPQALSVLRAVLDRFAPDRSALAYLAIGLSGVDFPDEFEGQKRALVDALGVPEDRLLLVNDGVVALAGAATTERATLVQHGTEVTMSWRVAAGQEEVFDSVGIADCFDIRLRVVALVARMLDGRAAVTPLRDRVLDHCGVGAAAFPRWMIRDPEARAQILRVAPVIFQAWNDQDPAAAQLIEAAVEDYVVATVAMADRMGSGGFEACFGGGTIAQGGPRLMRAIADRLAQRRPDAAVRIPATSPEDGALALARLAAARRETYPPVTATRA